MNILSSCILLKLFEDWNHVNFENSYIPNAKRFMVVVVSQ